MNTSLAERSPCRDKPDSVLRRGHRKLYSPPFQTKLNPRVACSSGRSPTRCAVHTDRRPCGQPAAQCTVRVGVTEFTTQARAHTSHAALDSHTPLSLSYDSQFHNDMVTCGCRYERRDTYETQLTPHTHPDTLARTRGQTATRRDKCSNTAVHRSRSRT